MIPYLEKGYIVFYLGNEWDNYISPYEMKNQEGPYWWCN